MQIQGAEQIPTGGTVRNVLPCTFLTCEICIAQISFLLEPPPSLAVLIRWGLSVATFCHSAKLASWSGNAASTLARMPLVISEAMFRLCRNSLPKAYKEVCFWQCDAVDAPYIFKRLYFKLPHLFHKIRNTGFILYRDRNGLFHRIGYLFCTRGDFGHAIGCFPCNFR